jgi:hypothetical protein
MFPGVFFVLFPAWKGRAARIQSPSGAEEKENTGLLLRDYLAPFSEGIYSLVSCLSRTIDICSMTSALVYENR